MLTVGVDLGKRKSQWAVLDLDGKILVERKLPNNKAIVHKFLRSLPGKVKHVGCETCINCPPRENAFLIQMNKMCS